MEEEASLLLLPPELLWLIVLFLDGFCVFSFRLVHSYIASAYASNDFIGKRALAYYGRPTKRRYHWGHILALQKLMPDKEVQLRFLGDEVDFAGLRGAGWPNPWHMVFRTYRMGGCTTIHLVNVNMKFLPNCLYKMPNLRKLDISLNSLGGLKLAFKYPLKRLTANYASITHINVKRGKHEPAQRIRHLSLNDNYFNAFPWEALPQIQGLVSLQVRGHWMDGMSTLFPPAFIRCWAWDGLREQSGDLRRIYVSGNMPVQSVLGRLRLHGWDVTVVSDITLPSWSAYWDFSDWSLPSCPVLCYRRD